MARIRLESKRNGHNLVDFNIVLFNTNLFKSMRLNWRTPKAVYQILDAEFNFDFDPCPPDPKFDGLNREWGNCNFVHPLHSILRL